MNRFIVILKYVFSLTNYLSKSSTIKVLNTKNSQRIPQLKFILRIKWYAFTIHSRKVAASFCYLVRPCTEMKECALMHSVYGCQPTNIILEHLIKSYNLEINFQRMLKNLFFFSTYKKNSLLKFCHVILLHPKYTHVFINCVIFC